MWCHLPFLLPLLGLALFFVLPLWAALPLYGGLLLVTLLFTIPVLRAARAPVTTGREGLVGARGVTVTEIASAGTVRVRGELWAAEADERIGVGEAVTVLDVRGLTLTVRRRGS